MVKCDICDVDGYVWEMTYDKELGMWFHVSCRNDPKNWKYIRDMKRLQRGGCKDGPDEWSTYKLEGGGR